jgi:CheY-like chemotaxis protein
MLANLIEGVFVSDARTVSFDTEVSDGAVLGDRTKLTNAFATLLANMLEGDGLLRVALRQEAGSFIVTLVGPRRRMPTAGLDPDLFALERRIMRVHGGAIRLVDRSDEDVVEVALPALVDGGRPPLTRMIHAGLAGARVLIVDTGSPWAATATFALRHHGANVLCVGDVPVALDACACFAPEVIVLCAADDSVSLTVTQLRGVAGATGIVVVTEASSEEAPLDRDAGVDAHVAAPVDPYVLVYAVEAVVRFARQVEPSV